MNSQPGNLVSVQWLRNEVYGWMIMIQFIILYLYLGDIIHGELSYLWSETSEDLDI